MVLNGISIRPARLIEIRQYHYKRIITERIIKNSALKVETFVIGNKNNERLINRAFYTFMISAKYLGKLFKIMHTGKRKI